MPSTNTNSIGNSTKDEMDSECSTKLNFQPHRLSLQRDLIPAPAEPKMLQNACNLDESTTKPINGRVLQHVIPPSKSIFNTASYSISSADGNELHRAVYRISSPLTNLVQQNSHGFPAEISESMRGLTASNQYHPHSVSFGFSFVPGLDSNYIFDSASSSSNLQPNNLNSQLEHYFKVESDGLNPFPETVTKLRNGPFLHHVIAPKKSNLNTASYTISSAQNDEFYRIPSPLTTLVQQTSHRFLSDIIQGLTISNQYHSYSHAFGIRFDPGFESNYMSDNVSSFINM